MTESGPTDTSNKKVVFVIDDERVIATTLGIILNNAGFEVHVFFSGYAGYEWHRSRDHNPHKAAKLQNPLIFGSGSHCGSVGIGTGTRSRI